MDIFKELEKLSVKYISISDKKEKQALEDEYRAVFSKLETVKIAQRNEINALDGMIIDKKKEFSMLEAECSKVSKEIAEQKKSIASSLDILGIKEVEVGKLQADLAKDKSELDNVRHELLLHSNELIAREEIVSAKNAEADKKLAIVFAKEKEIEDKQSSLNISFEKMDRLIDEQKRIERQVLTEREKLGASQKSLAEDYSRSLKIKEDLEVLKASIAQDKKEVEKMKQDVIAEYKIIQNMKDELGEMVAKNNEIRKDLNKREADVKVMNKNIDDKENAIKAKELDLRMERARISEDKNKFNLLLKERGMKPEDLQF